MDEEGGSGADGGLKVVEGWHNLPHMTPYSNLQQSRDFKIACLGGIAMLNTQWLMYRPPEAAWKSIISHLLFILHNSVTLWPICLQAAHTLHWMMFSLLSRSILPLSPVTSRQLCSTKCLTSLHNRLCFTIHCQATPQARVWTCVATWDSRRSTRSSKHWDTHALSAGR